ncbi:MAG TPA: hypothetical protein VFK80_07990 [Limnochordia bacterium]|nr:hypothetical protein [Limnochordia bacterium]
MSSRILLLVGTRKGLFTFASDAKRRVWRETGPLLPSWEVTGLLGDSRHGHRLFAGTGHMAYGATLRVSSDLGKGWTQLLHSPRYPAESGRIVHRIWDLAAHPTKADTLYAGVDEAGLFISRDRGEHWTHHDTLGDDPTRPHWSRTKAGNPLHSLRFHPEDPQHMWALVGGAGVVFSQDGGVNWAWRNNGLPPLDDHPELTHGVHRLVADPHDPLRLYLQHTGGLFGTDDGGLNWQPAGDGLPSRFGFALAVSPAGDLYSIPLDPESRCFAGGRLRVYARPRGESAWRPLPDSLPAEPHFVGVLRDALVVDGLDPVGLYFGTTQGDLFVSPDGGAGWLRLPGQFSRINTLRVWALE